MKKSKKNIIIYTVFLTGIIISLYTLFCFNSDPCLDIVNTYVEAINKKDIELYISLFEDSIQREMKQYVIDEGTANFFKSDFHTLFSAKKVDDKSALKEKEMFPEVAVYEVVERISYVVDQEGNKKPTEVCLHHFVFVKNDNEWKLYRVSKYQNNDKSE